MAWQPLGCPLAGVRTAPGHSYLEVSSSNVATHAQGRGTLARDVRKRQSEKEVPGQIQHPAKGKQGCSAPALPHCSLQHPILPPFCDCRGPQRYCVGSPHHQSAPPHPGGKGLGLTLCRAPGLAVLSVRTLTSRGFRLRNTSSASGPEPIWRQRRVRTVPASACSSPLPAGSTRDLPQTPLTGPATPAPAPACAQTFLETLLQGVSEREAALQQELGEGFGGEGQAQALQCRLPRLGAARDRGRSRSGTARDGARPWPWLAAPAGTEQRARHAHGGVTAAPHLLSRRLSMCSFSLSSTSSSWPCSLAASLPAGAAPTSQKCPGAKAGGPTAGRHGNGTATHGGNTKGAAGQPRGLTCALLGGAGPLAGAAAVAQHLAAGLLLADGRARPAAAGATCGGGGGGRGQAPVSPAPAARGRGGAGAAEA